MSKDYRVIEILDKYSLLVNYGRDDGACEEDEVRVVSIGPDVIDPETQENLGTLDLIKDVLTITTAYDKFSLCKKIETTTKNILASPLTQFNTTSRVSKLLKVDESSFTNKRFNTNSTIEVGDMVEVL